MKEKNTNNSTEKEVGFFGKVKNGFVKFIKGLKNFFVKTARKNSSRCYGEIIGIGDFIVYDDHALISAVGMDDVVFTRKNVVSYCFDGLGPIDMDDHRATVKYKIKLDDNVVFPALVRQKNDVENLKAEIYVEKDKAHFLGSGKSVGSGKDGLRGCDFYGYSDCIVVVYRLIRIENNKEVRYQDSALIPFKNISQVKESKELVTVIIDGGETLSFKPFDDGAKKWAEQVKENSDCVVLLSD